MNRFVDCDKRLLPARSRDRQRDFAARQSVYVSLTCDISALRWSRPVAATIDIGIAGLALQRLLDGG
jgi:hypothetical protein